MRPYKSPVALLLVGAFVLVGYVPAISAGSQMWTKTLDQKITWHRVTNEITGRVFSIKDEKILTAFSVE